jgi:hypothetical protein
MYQPDERSRPNTMLNDQNRWDQVSCRPPCSPQEPWNGYKKLAQQREMHMVPWYENIWKKAYDTYP